MTALAAAECGWTPRVSKIKPDLFTIVRGPANKFFAESWVRIDDAGADARDDFRSIRIVDEPLKRVELPARRVADLAELRRLADAWAEETMFDSSVQRIVFNENYQRVIGFGERALPFIVEELRTSGGHWFWALKMITGADPVPEASRGNYEAMREAWLQWAAAKGL